MKTHIVLPILALAFALVSSLPAAAQSPAENSSQMIVTEDRLELSVTLSMETARRVLTRAGLSEADVATALMNRGPTMLYLLPVGIGPRFFTLVSGGQTQSASRFTVMCDGVKADFTLHFQRPASDDTSVQAHYFEGIEGLAAGAFVAMDENRKVLSTSSLSSTNNRAEVAMPKLPAAAAPAALPDSLTSVLADKGEVKTPPPSPPSQPQSRSKRWVGAVLLALVASMVALLIRKRSTTPLPPQT